MYQSYWVGIMGVLKAIPNTGNAALDAGTALVFLFFIGLYLNFIQAVY